jgi:hypothetical protein
MHTNVLAVMEYLGGKDHLVDLGVDWKIVLKGVFMEEIIRVGTGLMWVKIENFWDS